ncbi:MAG: hypothetical protein K2N80_16375 [Lachnospiraceae bacterium]|nr:hypothetical protein [Lachnospiraceae bacterium]
MSRIFINEWRRAINASVIIAIIGVMFCICFDSWNDLAGAMQSGSTVWCVYYFMSNSAFGGMCRNYILPVFATLPFAASFCEERNSRAVAYIASREGMRRYGSVKYIVNILMGGLVVAFGTVLLILFLRMRFQMISDDYEASVGGAADLFHKWLAVHYPVRYCMTEAALGFMRGMIWAGASMFVSLYLTDRLVITMFPFLGSYVIVRISQILSLDADWRFDQILTGRTVIRDSRYTVTIAAIVSGILVFLMGVCFTEKLVKGLRDGMFYESK